MRNLRKYVRFLLEKSISEKDKELLTEPDETEENQDKDEVSSGGVAGVAVPLGAGPHYPSKKTFRKKKQ